MAIATKEEAHTLLEKVVGDWWAQTGRPLLGSQLKVRMLEAAPDFNEKDFQYKTFSAFVRDCKGIAVEIRGTTDFAVAPAGHVEAFRAPKAEETRIRPHFWRAFVTFPKDNEVRGYVPDSGIVYIGPPASCPPSVPITPIPKQEQLKWRREFIESLGPDSELKSLLPELTEQGGFKAFTLALANRPALRKRWHSVSLNHVASTIKEWAKPLELPESVWLFTSESADRVAEVREDVTRQRIYALLDQIRTEDLLDLRLPVRWFLNMPSSKDS